MSGANASPTGRSHQINALLREGFQLAHRRIDRFLLDILWKFVWLVLTATGFLGIIVWFASAFRSIAWVDTGNRAINTAIAVRILREFWAGHWPTMLGSLGLAVLGSGILWFFLEAAFRSRFYSPPRRGGVDATAASGLTAQTGWSVRRNPGFRRSDHPGLRPPLLCEGINIPDESTAKRKGKLDESPSQIRNPRSKIGHGTLGGRRPSSHRQSNFPISDFGFEMGFCPISQSSPSGFLKYIDALCEQGNSSFRTFLLSNILKVVCLGSAALALGAICFSRFFAIPFSEWPQFWPDARGGALVSLAAIAALVFVLTIVDTLARTDALDLLGTDLFRVTGLITILLSFEAMIVAACAVALAAGLLNVAGLKSALGMLAAIGVAIGFLNILHSYLLLVRYSAVDIMRKNAIEV